MRRVLLISALFAFASILVTPAALAQKPGGIQPLCQLGCGGGAPWVVLDSPTTSVVTTQYPDIEIQFCMNTNPLNQGSILIKLNGVSKTSSFSVASGDPNGDCGGTPSNELHATTTSVALSAGSNTLYAYICDDGGAEEDDEEEGPHNGSPAAACSSHTWTITYDAPTPVKPQVVFKNLNSDNQDRGLCLTVGAGQAAGLSCGDLFVTHAMPVYRTMGRDRSLTLFYSSATAAPRPAVAVLVTEPSGALIPPSVLARLQINGVPKDSATYSTVHWHSPVTKQIVLAYDAKDDPSGIYPFTILVGNQYTGGPLADTISGEVLVVNRSTSEFGAGWWLDGVEQLVIGCQFCSGRILWIGGDGSAAVYNPVATNTWVRATGAYRDTLVYSTGALQYTRTLRHNVRVVFDFNGRHFQTINRVGHTTQFTWGSLAGYTRLLSIAVPTAGSSANTYALAYSGSYQFIDHITDPASRVTAPYVSTYLYTGTLGARYGTTYVSDPDNVHTQFAYDAVGRMTRRTDRLGSGTGYLYGDSLHVTRVRVPLTATAGDSATHTLAWWDSQGLAYGSPSATQFAADTGDVLTFYDGPRTDSADVAQFWVDRWGAPVRIVGAVKDTTLIARSTTTGLVSRLETPIHNVWGMTYNARGNLLTQTDSTHEGHGTGGFLAATTRYTYQDTRSLDSPDSVIDPEGVTSRFVYNSLGTDSLAIAPTGQQTRFLYGSGAQVGLLLSATDLQVPTYTDTVTWSGLSTSPMDQATSFTLNSLGNVSVVQSPRGSTTQYRYNAYTQVDTLINALGNTTLFFPRATGVVDSVVQLSVGGNRTFHTYYDAAFHRTSFVDPRGVSRAWSYDLAGRDTSETDDYGYSESRHFGPSGLLDSVRTRVAVTVKRSYDAAGRLTQIRYPARDTASMAKGDTLTYAYDAAGRMTSATNRSATTTRQYYREGTMKLEQSVEWGGIYNFLHAFRYDRADRRSAYADYSAGNNDTLKLGYTYASGLLNQLLIMWPGGALIDTATYTFDGLGRRQQLVTPHHHHRATVSWLYDLDGRLRRLYSANNCLNSCATDSAIVDKRVLKLDSLNRSRSIMTWVGSYVTQQDTNAFDDFGRLNFQQGMGGQATYTYDPSDNVVRVMGSGGFGMASVFAPAHNRLVGDSSLAGSTSALRATYIHDNAGNRQRDDGGPFAPALYRDLWYDAVGHMVSTGSYTTYSGVSAVDCNVLGLSFSEPTNFYPNFPCHSDSLFTIQTAYIQNADICRYDALGRRVRICNGLWAGYDGDQVVRVDNTRIVYGAGLDDPIAVYDPGTPYQLHYFVTDGAGRLLSYTDSMGTDARVGPYHVYRDKAVFSGAIAVAESYYASGNESNVQPALSYFRNRYYDQRTGRWMQEDPLGVAGGSNLYSYAGSNPVTFTDPFGLCIWDGCIAEVIAAGAMVATYMNALHNIRVGEDPSANSGRAALVGGGSALLMAGTEAMYGEMGAAASAGARTSGIGFSSAGFGRRTSGISPEQTDLLREFLGVGKNSAAAAQARAELGGVPNGLTRETLEIYRATTRHIQTPLQNARRELIDRTLESMPK